MGLLEDLLGGMAAGAGRQPAQAAGGNPLLELVLGMLTQGGQGAGGAAGGGLGGLENILSGGRGGGGLGGLDSILSGAQAGQPGSPAGGLGGMGGLLAAIGGIGGLIALLRQRHFTPVTLGPRVLRTETAGLAAIAALQVKFGDF